MWLPLAPRMLWVCAAMRAAAWLWAARAVPCCSAAPGLRALGRFADAGWQDLRAVHDSRGPCSEKGPFLARSSRGVSSDGDLRGIPDAWRAHLAKASPFSDAWSAKLATKPPPFSSEAPFGIHGVKKMLRIAARERIRAQSCHRQAPGNAFHGHFAISERPQRHSAMCLNVLYRSPIDARAERPAHALRARRSCPRAARHSAAMPCTVRGAFVAAEKVSCGLRVSMR